MKVTKISQLEHIYGKRYVRILKKALIKKRRHINGKIPNTTVKRLLNNSYKK